jgi:hypothetical protein
VTHSYEGWVKDDTTGQMLFSQNFSDWNSASNAAAAFMDSSTVNNLVFNSNGAEKIHWGVTQLS